MPDVRCTHLQEVVEAQVKALGGALDKAKLLQTEAKDAYKAMLDFFGEATNKIDTGEAHYAFAGAYAIDTRTQLYTCLTSNRARHHGLSCFADSVTPIPCVHECGMLSLCAHRP